MVNAERFMGAEREREEGNDVVSCGAIITKVDHRVSSHGGL